MHHYCWECRERKLNSELIATDHYLFGSAYTEYLCVVCVDKMEEDFVRELQRRAGTLQKEERV